MMRMVVAFVFVIVCLCLLGCSSAERRVRIFNVVNGEVLEIRNASPECTREMPEASPYQVSGTFSTLQNRLCCDCGWDRSIVRVYGTNANLLCASSVPFPDGVHLGPREFAVRSGRIIFWNTKFEDGAWRCANELCVANLNNGCCMSDFRRISVPAGCGSINDWDESLIWTSPSSVVVTVQCCNRTKKIAIIDVDSGGFRFLPFEVRNPTLWPSSVGGSLSKRYFSLITANGEVVVCDGRGVVCKIIGMDLLCEFGLRDMSESRNEPLSMCWDDNDALWIWNVDGEYVCFDVVKLEVAANGRIRLGCGEKVVGFVRRSSAVVMQRRDSDFIRSVLGNRFFIKDLLTGGHVAEMPNSVSAYTYLGDGLMLLEDL